SGILPPWSRVGVALLLAGAWLAAAPSHAAPPIIDVEKAADRRVAIGVDRYPAVSAEDVGSMPDDVLAFDLELSGLFQAIRPGMLPPRTLNDWARRGAEVLLELTARGDTLSGLVRDVGTGEPLFEREYPGSRPGMLRERLHRLADDVVEVLTGQRGLARTRILCEWDPGDGKRVVMMDVDGYGLHELTGESVLELGPRWSTDGGRAVYTSFGSGYPDVYIHDLRVGSRERVAHAEGLNAQGHLDPSGERLVVVLSFQGQPDIYTKDLASGTIRRLTNDAGTEASPSWSPDGHRIAFVSDRSGGPQIYVMNADGSRLQRVTVRGGYNTAPAWSPDGTRIAYCALTSGVFQIQVVDLDKRRVTTVTESGGCEDPCWSPDGRSILYSRTASGRSDLYITNLTERRALRVTRGSGKYTAPDWSPLP
ncbi:DPP IV N-terminal domain-containing protein, partial [bacterium]|nr:DPP IV N-terminal domain-containing protein [bacterium]